MSSKPRKLVLCLSLAFAIGFLDGAEEQYPMPQTYSQSLIMGKTLRNPFAAKLRISQSRMKDLVGGNAGKIEADLSERFVLGTTMYFGDGSKHNRAIINGRVQRPGDTLTLPGETEVVATLVAIRPSEVSLVYRDSQTGSAVDLTLETAKSKTSPSKE